MKAVWGLVVVLLSSGLLYFWQLDRIPDGIYVDEAVEGYNAWRLSVNGKDQYGKTLPLLFRLFGSYTPPIYIYQLVPLIKIWGLNGRVLRVGSVLYGVGTVAVFYVWLLEFFKEKVDKTIIGTVFFAILPWMVFNSRVGYEAMAGVCLGSLGSYFLWRSLKDGSYLGWAALSWSMASYCAHVQRYGFGIIVLLFGLMYLNRTYLHKNKKNLIITVIVLVVVNSVNFSLVGTEAFWIKNKAISDWSGAKVVQTLVRQTSRALWPTSIFVRFPDIDIQHEIPGLSLAYWWMVAPFFMGIWRLWKDKLLEDLAKYIGMLVVVGLLPGVLAGEFLSEQRLVGLIVPLGLIIALGYEKLAGGLTVARWGVSMLLMVYSGVLLWRGYFVLMPYFNSHAWNREYVELAGMVGENINRHFVVDNTRNPRSYILLAYYLKSRNIGYDRKIDEKKYYNNSPLLDKYEVDNVEFRPIVWKTDSCKAQMLVGDSLSVSFSQAKEHGLKLVRVITGPMGEIQLNVFEVVPQNNCWI